LRFARGRYLEEAVLQSRIEQLWHFMIAGKRISDDQIVVVADAAYEELREELIDVVENIHTDPRYSTEFENGLPQMYGNVRRLEKALVDGVREMINGMSHMRERSSVSLALHCYARIVRGELLARFAVASEVKHGIGAIPPLCSKCEIDALATSRANTKKGSRVDRDPIRDPRRHETNKNSRNLLCVVLLLFLNNKKAGHHPSSLSATIWKYWG
jgi:hypothetical protein